MTEVQKFNYKKLISEYSVIETINIPTEAMAKIGVFKGDLIEIEVLEDDDIVVIRKTIDPVKEYRMNEGLINENSDIE
tara:strand:- start:199 stop:432 length:234 start_codon:yes stop_codon:yes gene_type:complete